MTAKPKGPHQIVNEIVSKICGIDMQLELSTKELENLSAKQKHYSAILDCLEENLNFLRKDKIVVSIMEYFKSSNSVVECKEMLANVLIDYRVKEAEISRISSRYKIVLEQYELAMLAASNDRQILPFQRNKNVQNG